jgi:glutamate N-acetyltransferase/amino-acid N-acetyltransferase
MAIGKNVDLKMAPAKVSATINGFMVVRNGARMEFDDATVRAALSTSVVDLEVELGVGMASATAYGCDLSKGYIEENAAYYSS